MTDLVYDVTVAGATSTRRPPDRRRPVTPRGTRRQRSGAACYAEARLRGAPPAAVVASTAIGDPFVAARPRLGQTVVDLGGGFGLDAIIAGRLVGPKGHVHLVDHSAFAIGVARRNARLAGADNITCLHADMATTTVPPASADWVISNHALSFAPDRTAALRHARRLLRPGAVLVCTTLARTGAARTCPHAPLPAHQVERCLTDAGFTRPAIVDCREIGRDLAAVTVVGHAPAPTAPTHGW
jgi:SAM-dependent methyltransferase